MIYNQHILERKKGKVAKQATQAPNRALQEMVALQSDNKSRPMG
jgi:hypothetical protein